MQLALSEAHKGIGNTAPNPLVGAVVVRNGLCVGKGAHLRLGEAHAEVHALNEAGTLADGADLYVTLEPCSHQGKTPPCALRVIESGIKRVFIAMKDPNPMVSGKGISMMEEAGIEVNCGLLQQEAYELNQPFIKGMLTRRSYLFLKAAITLDGKIAARGGDSRWISNPLARKNVDRYRLQYSGVICGAETLRKDDPGLAIRTPEYQTGEDPYRVFIGTSVEGIDSRLQAIRKAADGKTLLFLHEDQAQIDATRLLIQHGVRIEYFSSSSISWDEILRRCYELGIDSLMLEGGSRMISTALDQDVVDSGEIFIAPVLLGDDKAVSICSGFNPTSIAEGIRLKQPQFSVVDDNASLKFCNHFYANKES